MEVVNDIQIMVIFKCLLLANFPLALFNIGGGKEEFILFFSYFFKYIYLCIIIYNNIALVPSKIRTKILTYNINFE